jgi:hypothetical protein
MLLIGAAAPTALPTMSGFAPFLDCILDVDAWIGVRDDSSKLSVTKTAMTMARIRLLAAISDQEQECRQQQIRSSLNYINYINS